MPLPRHVAMLHMMPKGPGKSPKSKQRNKRLLRHSRLIAEISQRLRSARLEAGYKYRRDACEALQGEQEENLIHSLRQWETEGKQLPNPVMLRLIAQTYGVSTDYLLCLTDSKDGLQVGSAIVDQDALEAVEKAHTRSGLTNSVRSTKHNFCLAFPITRGCRVVDMNEFAEIKCKTDRLLSNTQPPDQRADNSV